MPPPRVAGRELRQRGRSSAPDGHHLVVALGTGPSVRPSAHGAGVATRRLAPRLASVGRDHLVVALGTGPSLRPPAHGAGVATRRLAPRLASVSKPHTSQARILSERAVLRPNERLRPA